MSGVRKFAKIAMNLDAWTVAYIGGMTTKPSSAHIQLIDKFVKTTKSILSNNADVFYFGNINNSNDSFRNLVKNAHHGTIQGSGLVWDSYVGNTNPLGTGWVDTNYNPATQGVKYTLNDAGIGLYVFGINTGKSLIGATNGVSYSMIRENYYAINANTNVGKPTIPFYYGYHQVNRRVSNTSVYVNQNIINTSISSNSSSIPSYNFHIFGYNGSGNNTDKCVCGINCVYVGASLTDDEYVIINNAINEYLIGCLFIKYGTDNWGVKMAKSYFYDLHGYEKYEAWEVYEFIKRHQSDYTYTLSELATNSGVAGMTDWVDSNSDGLADGWATSLNPICSIVTGNGFIGNAQRIIENDATFNGRIYINNLSLVNGKTYNISGKYRTSSNFRLNKSNGVTFASFSTNVGNALPFSYVFTSDYSGVLYFTVAATDGNWLEIDEISIKEVFESDTVNFNKILNGGFGLATDFVDSNSDGLADNWVNSVNSTPSIVIGNGFTKNAQRLVKTVSSAALTLTQNQNLIIGRSYTLMLKYRSNVTIALYTETSYSYGNIGLATNTATETYLTFTAVGNQLYVGNLSAASTLWFEISEVLLIDNSNTQFYYNVFGPNGLNKSTSDYLLMFKAGGNLIASSLLKTGASLRWNHDGSVTNTIAMSIYTRGTNLGVITVSSIDGWNGLVQALMSQTASSVNSYYGNFPSIFKLKTIGPPVNLTLQGNRMKIDLRGYNLALLTYGLRFENTTFPGYLRININDMVGGTYSNVVYIMGVLANTSSSVSGNLSLFTNEIYTTSASFNIYQDRNVVGGLENIVLNNDSTVLNFNNLGITKGLLNWRKSILSLSIINCLLNTTEVDLQLKSVNDYFALNTPIKNLTLNLSGASMGIPTGGVNNTDLLGIIAKHVAAGFTATISVRTS